MNKEAMKLYGQASMDYINGDESAKLILVRDDGYIENLFAEYLFREPSEFSKIEETALDSCRGRILDVGAGVGPYSLALQGWGFDVHAIDESRDMCEMMKKRRVENVYCGSIFEFVDVPFDTLLMLNHGIGIVKTLSGLDDLLGNIHRLVKSDGQVLLDSKDATKTTEPKYLNYLDNNRKNGRYFAEIRLRVEYKNTKSPEWEWILVDPKTLSEHASKNDWSCEILHKRKDGDYLARLTPSGAEKSQMRPTRKPGSNLKRLNRPPRV
jgi:SAM-dependent methyltransferase